MTRLHHSTKIRLWQVGAEILGANPGALCYNLAIRRGRRAPGERRLHNAPAVPAAAGGEIVPVLLTGCAFGAWAGPLLGLPLYALCRGVACMLSGCYRLYSEQKILYSKFKPEWADKNTD